ncbi:MAG: DUF6157 family protein [Arenicella sp.]
MASTNYFNVFIEVAEDTKATSGNIPPIRGNKKSIANYEYDIVSENPYQYTSDDVIFMVHAQRNDIPQSALEKERELFFAKGRPCFRASALTKTYGWGVHSNGDGKIAIYGVESKEYAQFIEDSGIKKKKAMRSRKR